MKKTLLFILLIAFGISSFAQSAMMKQHDRLQQIKMERKKPVNDETSFTNLVVSTYTANDRAADVVIGNTVFDLQSNATMQHRNFIFPDGSMSAIWTQGFVPTSYPERGTGYNYYDGTSWGPVPTERIEDVRTGWPEIAPYGVNGEIIVAHTGGTAGLLFSWRENKGTGDWSTFNLVGPAGHQDILWPRMITSGENNEIIHVICITPPVANEGTIYEGLDGALLYSRSSDGGLTWDPENAILEGTNSDYTAGWSGDEYCFAPAQGNTIAFDAFGGFTDGIVMKSTDGGDSWERIPFYNSPEPMYDGSQVLPRFGGGDSYNAAVIDETGKVHVAFGRMLHTAAGDGTESYYPFTDGLLYWNEDMPPLDSAMIGSDIYDLDNLEANGYLLARVQDHGSDTIIDVAVYQAALTSMPQLVCKDGFIYAQYSAVSLGFDNSSYNYRHIWGEVSEGDGKWSAPTDYTTDVFHIFSECAFPSSSPTVGSDGIHTIYQTSNMPGIAERYEDHDHIDNNIVDLKIFPLHVGLDNIQSTPFEVSQNSPNPAVSNTTIVVNTERIGQIQLTVNNVLGQVVYTDVDNGTTLGAHVFRINVSDYESGLYFYTISMGEASVTKKMLVK